MHLYFPRVTEAEIGPHATADLNAWLFLQIAGGHVALPILVATLLFAKTVVSQPVVVTVCIAWVLASVFSLLLFYVGQHTGPEPSQALCITQASLLGAAPTLICSALFVLAFQVWRTYDGRDVSLFPESRRRRLASHLIYAMPLVVFGVFVAISVNLALSHKARVNREQRYFYCSLDWSPFSTAVGVLAMLLCLAAVILEVHIAITARRYWRLLRSGGHLTNGNLSLIIRTCALTFYLLTSSIVNLVSIWVPMGVAPDLLYASVGLVLFLIFVSRWDILLAWSFWRRTSSPYSNASRSAMTNTSTTLTPVPQRRHRAYRSTDSSTLGDVPALMTSKPYDSVLDHKGYYESKKSAGPGHGVQIIRRPDEAFKNARIKPEKTRSTISTWGF